MNSNNRQSFSIHTTRIIIYLLLAGITALFLSLTLAYGYTRWQQGLEPIRVPILFWINILILLAASLSLRQAGTAFQRDNTKLYKRFILAALFATILFLCSQSYAWYKLFQSDLPLGINNGVSYLYLISGVHFAHVLVGIPFLLRFYLTAVVKMVEPVSVLLYFSDPEKKVKLDLLTLYWHFLDFLWIYLVVFFTANYYL